MASVYSTRFCLHAESTSVYVPVYTVPAGYVAVLRCIDVYFGSVTGDQVIVDVSGAPFWSTPISTVGSSSVPYRGRQVMQEGEILNVNYVLASGGFAGVMASGYLLST